MKRSKMEWTQSPGHNIAPDKMLSGAFSFDGWLNLPAIHIIVALIIDFLLLLYVLFFLPQVLQGYFPSRDFYFYFYWLIAYIILMTRWVYVGISYLKRSTTAPLNFVHQLWAVSATYFVFAFLYYLMEESSHLWTEILLLYASIVFIISFCYRYAFNQSALTNSTFVNPPSERNYPSRKLGGWLFIPALQIFVQESHAIYKLLHSPELLHFNKFFEKVWDIDHYMIFIDLVLTLAASLAWIIAGALYIRMRSIFPAFFITILLVYCLRNVAFIICEMSFFDALISYTYNYLGNAVFFLGTAIAYTIAFFRSKRAKATFVN